MEKPQPYSKSVIDIFPWSNGLGFENADVWWRYVASRSERDRLDLLMMLALLSDEVSRLVLEHDPALLGLFALSEPTVTMLSGIEVATLEEFTQRLIEKRLQGERRLQNSQRSLRSDE